MNGKLLLKNAGPDSVCSHRRILLPDKSKPYLTNLNKKRGAIEPRNKLVSVNFLARSHDRWKGGGLLVILGHRLLVRWIGRGKITLDLDPALGLFFGQFHPLFEPLHATGDPIQDLMTFIGWAGSGNLGIS